MGDMEVEKTKLFYRSSKRIRSSRGLLGPKRGIPSTECDRLVGGWVGEKFLVRLYDCLGLLTVVWGFLKPLWPRIENPPP